MARSAWSEERIRLELAEFLAGRDEWPSYRDFWSAGRKRLRDMVTESGGARRWAREMGVRYVERRPGYAPVWTEERIRRELESFVAGRTFWPSRADFEAAGRKPLRDAVTRTGGAERWAAEVGLPRRDRRAGSRRAWSPEEIERELRRFLGARTTWPTKREFRQAGLASLLQSIYMFEGVESWRRRLGVEPGRRGPEAPALPVWTEDRIRGELARFCARGDRWPAFSEFEAAGKGALYRAASRHGGVARWAAELQLPRGRRRARAGS